MTMVIYAIRTTHQNSSMMTIGTKALPAPRQIDAIAWEYASRQKNSAVVRIWRVPSSTTSGVGLNSATSCGASRYIVTPMISAITTDAMIPKREPFFARS